MPSKKFLEDLPLYRKFELEKLPDHLRHLEKPSINMECQRCESNQTFVIINNYSESYPRASFPTKGSHFRIVYRCSHCHEFERLFFVKIDFDGKLFKIGQYPAWDIEGNSNIEDLLGEHSDYYKKGLICESQSYGIAAFSYYRRIVEEIIDSLLDEITSLLTGEELEKYKEALEQTKKTRVAQEKIDLVKNLLPPILRPDNMNPLSTLHSTLSEGLHGKTDPECLELAETCREILVFLVSQVSATKKASKDFTESMQKLLDKKSASN